MVVEDAGMKPLEGTEVENRPLTEEEQRRKDLLEAAARIENVRGDVFVQQRVEGLLTEAALVASYAPRPMTTGDFATLARGIFSRTYDKFRASVRVEHEERLRSLDNVEWVIVTQVPETQKTNPKQENEE